MLPLSADAAAAAEKDFALRFEGWSIANPARGLEAVIGDASMEGSGATIDWKRDFEAAAAAARSSVLELDSAANGAGRWSAFISLAPCDLGIVTADICMVRKGDIMSTMN